MFKRIIFTLFLLISTTTYSYAQADCNGNGVLDVDDPLPCDFCASPEPYQIVVTVFDTYPNPDVEIRWFVKDSCGNLFIVDSTTLTEDQQTRLSNLTPGISHVTNSTPPEKTLAEMIAFVNDGKEINTTWYYQRTYISPEWNYISYPSPRIYLLDWVSEADAQTTINNYFASLPGTWVYKSRSTSTPTLYYSGKMLYEVRENTAVSPTHYLTVCVHIKKDGIADTEYTDPSGMYYIPPLPPPKVTAQSGAWSDTSTWVGGVLPQDGDEVVISSGHEVLMDVDLSSYTGLRNTVVQGGVTPGMLYWKNGTSGYLKMRNYSTLYGTTDVNRGRLLANADGIWDSTTPLSSEYKAVIDLQNEGLILADQLEPRLIATQPELKYVNVYGLKYDFVASESSINVENDTIDMGVTPPVAGTMVMFIDNEGTIPGGFEDRAPYWVRLVSGNTFKLATQNSDDYILDIESVGSGNLTLYRNGTTTTNTFYTIQDISSDPVWSTDDGFNEIYFLRGSANSYSTINSYMRYLISKTSNSITFDGTGINSTYVYPGTIAIISRRNVFIRSASNDGESKYWLHYGNSTYTGSILGCSMIDFATSSSYNYQSTYVYKGNDILFTGFIGRSRNNVFTSSNDVKYYGVIYGTSSIGGSTSETSNQVFDGYVFNTSFGMSNWRSANGPIKGYFQANTIPIIGQNLDIQSTFMYNYYCSFYNSTFSGLYICEGSDYGRLIDSSDVGGNIIGGTIISCGSGLVGDGTLSSPVTFTGLIKDCGTGIYNCEYVNMQGTITNCKTGLSKVTRSNITGEISKGNIANQFCFLNNYSGDINNYNYGFYVSGNNNISGTLNNVDTGLYQSHSNVVMATMTNGTYGSRDGVNNKFKGIIDNYQYGIYKGFHEDISGTISNSNTAIVFGQDFAISPIITNTSNIFSIGEEIANGYVKSGTQIPTESYVFPERPIIGQKFRLSVEDADFTVRKYRTYEMFGDIENVPNNGLNGAPFQAPNGETRESVKVYNLLQGIDQENSVPIFKNYRVWAKEGARTITFYVQNAFSSQIDEGNLKLSCEYIKSNNHLTLNPKRYETLYSSPAIQPRTRANDWSQTISVSFNQAEDGWVDINLDLYQRLTGENMALYIYPIPVII